MADEIKKPLVDQAEQNVLMREMFKVTPESQIVQPNVPAMFGGQNITPVRQTPVVTRGPMTGPITAGMAPLTGMPGGNVVDPSVRQNVNTMPVNLGGQNISPRGPIPRMQEGGPVQEGGMPMPPGGMPTGETANAGIMEGFNPDQQAVGQIVSDSLNNVRNHEDIMNMIRGDEKTVEERKAELADVVGEEDAEATPDSSLTITQFGMKQITEANQAIEQGEEPEGIASLPEGQEAIDMDQGALMGAQPEVPQVPETVMPGMAFGGMVQRYAYGGEVTKEGVPVQRFFPGGIALAPWLARTGMAIPLLRRYSMKKGREIFAKKGKKSPGVKKLGEVLKKEEAAPSGLFKIKGLTGRQKIHRGTTAGGVGAYAWPRGEEGEKPQGETLQHDLSGFLKTNKQKKKLKELEANNKYLESIGVNPVDELQKMDPKGYEELISSMKSKKAKENYKVMKEMLGDEGDYYKKQAWLQLAHFGMNLASSKGGQSLTSAIAESAKEPMAAVGALGAEEHQAERSLRLKAAEQAIVSEDALEKLREEKWLDAAYPTPGSAEKDYKFYRGLGMSHEESLEEMKTTKGKAQLRMSELEDIERSHPGVGRLMREFNIPIEDQDAAFRAQTRIQKKTDWTDEERQAIVQEEIDKGRKKKAVDEAPPALTQDEIDKTLNDEDNIKEFGSKEKILEEIKKYYPGEDFSKFSIKLGD